MPHGERRSRRISWMAVAWIAIGIGAVVDVCFFAALPNDGPPRLTPQEIDFNLLYSAMEHGKPEEAEGLAQAYMKNYPDSADDVRHRLIDWHRKNKRPAKALEHANKMLEAHPKDVETLLLVGEVACEADDLPRSLLAYHQAVKESPRDARAFRGVALTYHAMGDVFLAVHNLQRAVSLDRNDKESRRLLAEWQGELAQRDVRHDMPYPGVPDPMEGMPFGGPLGASHPTGLYPGPSVPDPTPRIPVPQVPGRVLPRMGTGR